jgi:putative FmdB family regulatory protein
MPIYEYVCMKCEHHFEELVHGDETPACPSCAAKKVIRKYSSFATIGGPSKSCGSCAGGNCGGCGGH